MRLLSALDTRGVIVTCKGASTASLGGGVGGWKHMLGDGDRKYTRIHSRTHTIVMLAMHAVRAFAVLVGLLTHRVSEQRAGWLWL